MATAKIIPPTREKLQQLMEKECHKIPTKDEFRKRVTRGAKLLDRIKPGWHTKLDLTTLNMDSPIYCILGLVFGSFETGCRKINKTEAPHLGKLPCGGLNSSSWYLAALFGFYVMLNLDIYDDRRVENMYGHLTKYWKQEIMKRNNKPAKVRKKVK